MFGVLITLAAILLSLPPVFSSEAQPAGGVADPRANNPSVAMDPPSAVYTNIAAIMSLNPDKSPQRVPVHLQGVGIQMRSNVFAFIEGGMVVFVDDLSPAPSFYEKGEVLDFEGYVDLVAPSYFKATRVSLIRKGRVPDPRSVDFDDILTGSLDNHWVSIAGVVRRIEMYPDGAWMAVYSGGRKLSVRLPGIIAQKLAVGDEVKLTGACFSRCDDPSHVMHPFMLIPTPDFVRIINKMPDPFSLPVRTFSRTPQFFRDIERRYGVRIHGVVIHGDPGKGFWVRDGISGVYVRSYLEEQTEPGDEVDVFGFIAGRGYSVMLEDALFRKVGRVSPLKPVRLDSPAQAPAHDADLVEVEGIISGRQPGMGESRWTVFNGTNQFVVVLKGDGVGGQRREWIEGSAVRVAGICQVEPPEDYGHSPQSRPASFQILMRSPDDLVLLHPAPWWTPAHVAMVMAGISGGLLLSLIGVVFAVRLRLRRQAEERRKAEGEFAAMWNERNRMAREIHDTVIQTITGLAYQIEACESESLPLSERPVNHLEIARRMAQRGQADLRNALWALRALPLHEHDFVQALRTVCCRLAEERGVKASVQSSGVIPRLPDHVAGNLLLFVQEAMFNAVKHAKSSNIEVSIAAQNSGKEIVLVVHDDGVGFMLDARPGPAEGHFGLAGMRERVECIGGTLKIESKPGQGTSVRAEVPLRD